jgi:glycosyltransferase involved in cell wall biosynthesis
MTQLSSFFTLIIPVYNPPPGWEVTLISHYEELCNHLSMAIPLIIVNDGSSVNISEAASHIVNTLGVERVQYHTYSPNRGKGGALKVGASYVKTRYAVFTDVDLPYTLQSMVNVLNGVFAHGGIIAGNRESDYYESLSDFRTYLSKSLRIVNRFVLGLPVNDTQCGLKAFDDEGRNILLACKTERFLIDLELLLSANAQKVKITPIKVELRPDISFTKFNPAVLLNEVSNFIKLLWKYRVLDGRY